MNPFNDIETWETLLGLSEGRQLNQIAHESKISLAALIRRIRTIENTWGVKFITPASPARSVLQSLLVLSAARIPIGC